MTSNKAPDLPAPLNISESELLEMATALKAHTVAPLQTSASELPHVHAVIGADGNIEVVEDEVTEGLPEDDEFERRFGGVARLYGDDTLKNFTEAHVLIAGLGGVGSWVAEGLARTGIGQMTLIDFDAVAPSNINRQLPALTQNFGHDKTAVMAERLNQINPRLRINVVEDFITPDNLVVIVNEALANKSSNQPLVMVDATDDMKAKQAMAELALSNAYRKKVALVICGGAGGKEDPTQIKVADLWQTSYDPLLASLRSRLRKAYPSLAKKKKSGLISIYSTEVMQQPQACNNFSLNCGGYGSAVSVTASFGMFAVATALKKIQMPAKTKQKSAKIKD